MELPHVGRNCFLRTCNRLDFLPLKCGACLESFCSDHFAYASHECPASNSRDVQVPECPLCGAAVPVRRGELPDVALSEHIDSMCQSDPARENRQVYTHTCSYKGCKTKEMMPVVCTECELNYCLEHRHGADHDCETKQRKATAREEPAKSSLNQKHEHVTQPAQPDPNETPEEFMRRRAAEAAMARLQSGQSRKVEFKTRIASNPGRARVATIRDVQTRYRSSTGNGLQNAAVATALSLSGLPIGGGEVAIARSLAQNIGAAANNGYRSSRPPRRYNNGGNSGFQMNSQNLFHILKIVGGIVFVLYVLGIFKLSMFKSGRR